MKVFVTGASGFIGKAVVHAASAHGHEVLALVRATSVDRVAGSFPDGVEIVPGDIRYDSGWSKQLDGCDAVLHLAASFGDPDDQWATTVVGTEVLLAGMKQHDVGRMVLVSTFSVYDYAALAPGSTLDENSPIEADALHRDAYAETKLWQERLVKEAGIDLTIIRPGAVFGVGKLWDGGFLSTVGDRVGIAVGPGVAQKLTYVDNCAEAIVLSAEVDAAIGETLNIVDDALPSQRAYASAMRAAGFDLPPSVPVPYRLVSLLAKAAALVNTKLLGGGAKYPEFLVPERLDARFKPLSYSNQRAKDVLGWTPKIGLAEALERVAKATR